MAALAAEAADQRMVHLVSQEGESFDVQLGVAKMSELVNTMIDGKSPEPLPHFCVLGVNDNMVIVDLCG